MRKIDRALTPKMKIQECDTYWRRVHSTSFDDLAAVCFPDKPRYFNLFFDRVQKFAIDRFLKHENIQVVGRKWLDLGCGRGRWLRHLSTLGARVQGIDLSQDAVHHCRRLGFEVAQGTIDRLPFDSASFDFVSSVTVLMHLPPPARESAIAELSRVLAPRGLAVVLEATRDTNSPHVYDMSLSEWHNAFSARGLNLIHVSGHCLGLLRNSLPRWLPFRDCLSTYLDYPTEYAFMKACYGKQSERGWQHLMIFRKGNIV